MAACVGAAEIERMREQSQEFKWKHWQNLENDLEMVDQKRTNNEFQVSSMDDKILGGTQFLMKVPAVHMENHPSTRSGNGNLVKVF